MKLFYSLLTVLFAVTATFAQTFGTVNANQVGGTGGNSAALSYLLGDLGSEAEKRAKNPLSNAQGSPYTSNSFSPASLYYEDEKVGTFYFRYNALNEEIELKKSNTDEETIRGLARDKELNIRPNGKKMSFKTFVTSKKRTTNGYLTELVKGEKYDLYKRIRVKFTEATAAQNSFVKAIPARFTQFTEYYFQENGVNRIDEILLKKGKLMKLVDSSKKDELKEFMKENNINLKNENELIQVFEFLNK